MPDTYGEAFGKRLGAKAKSFTTRALPQSLIAVTELRYDTPQMILSTPPAAEDAFIVGVHLKHYPKYEYWEDGKAAAPSVLRPGEAIIYDVRRRPEFHLNSSFHSVHFYFPSATLTLLADQAGVPRIDGLRYTPGVSQNDPVLYGMAQTLLPVFQQGATASRLFLDHLMLAAGHHVAYRYGGMAMPNPVPRGGLSRNQERIALDLIMANLGRDLPLSELAETCGLSLSHFSKAFRETTGMPPHRWLLQRRIEKAKSLLHDTALSIADVAVTCGFADQSHLTRSFTAIVGTSPNRWRRSLDM